MSALIAARLRRWACLAALAVFAGSLLADPLVSREERIKAVLVFKILKFVTWPPATLAAKDPLVLCVAGEAPITEALTSAEGRLIGENPVVLRRVHGLSLTEVKACHALYLSASIRDAGSVLAALRGKPLLTLGDAPDFARRGGCVGLLRGENRLVFEVSLKAVRENGLEMAAPLLELATLVD